MIRIDIPYGRHRNTCDIIARVRNLQAIVARAALRLRSSLLFLHQSHFCALVGAIQRV